MRVYTELNFEWNQRMFWNEDLARVISMCVRPSGAKMGFCSIPLMLGLRIRWAWFGGRNSMTSFWLFRISSGVRKSFPVNSPLRIRISDSFGAVAEWRKVPWEMRGSVPVTSRLWIRISFPVSSLLRIRILGPFGAVVEWRKFPAVLGVVEGNPRFAFPELRAAVPSVF